jgi:hypothetical protein
VKERRGINEDVDLSVFTTGGVDDGMRCSMINWD